RRTAVRAGIGVAAVLALGALGVYASPRLLPEIPGTLRGLRLPEHAGDFLDSLTASLSRVASTSLSRVAAMLAPSLTPPDQDPRIASGPPVPSVPTKPAGVAEEAHPGSPPPAESMPTQAPAGATEEARPGSPPPAQSMPAPAPPPGGPPAGSPPPRGGAPPPGAGGARRGSPSGLPPSCRVDACDVVSPTHRRGACGLSTSRRVRSAEAGSFRDGAHRGRCDCASCRALSTRRHRSSAHGSRLTATAPRCTAPAGAGLRAD